MAGNADSWVITGQVTGQAVNNDAGQTIVGSYVYYKTGFGNTGSVFVPDNLLSEAHVRETVAAAAKLLDGIGRLSQGKV
jgi:hypothetical protein